MTRRPNILWFISDDTSAGAFGYTGGRVLTPNIDRVARDGVVQIEIGIDRLGSSIAISMELQ